MLCKTKKFLFMITIAIALCVMTYVNAEESITFNDESEQITVYPMSPKVFNSFLENPSMDFLSNNVEKVEIYSKVTQKTGWIKRRILSSNSVKIDEFPEEWHNRIGDVSVFASLIEFFSNTEAIQDFLMENGVTDKVESVVLLDGYFVRSIGVPLTAWIKTLDGNYFITIQLNYISETAVAPEIYLYRFYSYMDYKNKFGLKDGTLIVNGIDITEDHYFKLQYMGACLPFRAVMEQLGAIIEWDSTQNAVLMDCNGKKYILETEPWLSLFEEGTEHNLLLTPPGGDTAYGYAMINDRIIMDEETMQKCTSLMNANVEVDINNLLVTIK